MNKKHKFDEIYEGPFKVIKSYDCFVEIIRRNKTIKLHKNMVKKAQAQYLFGQQTESNILENIKTIYDINLTETNVLETLTD